MNPNRIHIVSQVRRVAPMATYFKYSVLEVDKADVQSYDLTQPFTRPFHNAVKVREWGFSLYENARPNLEEALDTARALNR